jgi:hypothetical protein
MSPEAYRKQKDQTRSRSTIGMVRFARAKFDMSNVRWVRKRRLPGFDRAWATKLFRDFLGGPRL